ncbi:recombinase family protein [Aquimarina celericrescens]|uniref:Recombinase family protein n=1 Tax=Aquimarina celericrescens TaxID=1964542 RepID=A0ABW5AWE1_9FLAO|nr:recombinase family protein [Aquimarina celericrescens]
MLFGYARISTSSQNLDLQVDALLKAGVDIKNIYKDISSGAKAHRKNLDLMLDKLREDDIVIVWKMDRIARSVSHMLKLVEQFNELGVSFKSIQESFMDTTSAHGKFIFTLFSAIAQMERDIIIERTRAGLDSARRRGVQFGRKRGLNEEAKKKAILAEKYYRDNKLSITDIMKLVDIKSKPTLYKYLAHQGRRNCVVCKKLFWDKGQMIDDAYCEKHIKN